LCSHFNTDDGRKKATFWHTVFYYFKKGKNATEMQKKKIVQYGGGAVTEQMCQKWFVKFHVGNFPLDDAPWSGRPIAADSEHIKT